MLAGCGGGAGSTAASHGTAFVPAPASSLAPAITTGPVTYLESTGPFSSVGTIQQGARQAIVAAMSSAAESSDGFASDTLVVGTAATSQSALRSISAAYAKTAHKAMPRTLAPVEAFPADDSLLLRRLRARALSSASSSSRRSLYGVRQDSSQVGTDAPIWVQRGSLGGSRTNVQVRSTLVAQTAHANIWIDDAIASNLKADAPQIGADFENAYASDVAHFASPDYSSDAPGLQPQYSACSAGGSQQGTTSAYITEPQDRRINVMVVDSQNLGGLGGYFSAANYMPQAALNCLNGGYESNEAPFIFVGWFAGQGSWYELQEDLVRSTAHELQHLINFVNHSILAAAASSASFDGSETTFINEGLSMLAQDLAVQKMYGSRGVQFDADDALARANAFLNDPGSFSLSGFSGIDQPAWGGNGSSPQFNCAGGCYGAAYLFQRYLRDRFGSDAYTHAMEESGSVGAANLQAITGESLGDLQGDFALAMAAATMGVNSADRRFDFGSLSLVRSYADQFGSGTTLSGVFATPANGSSTSVHAPLGGFAYVAVPSVPSSGMPVQVTDQASVGGFGLMGGLAQH